MEIIWGTEYMYLSLGYVVYLFMTFWPTYVWGESILQLIKLETIFIIHVILY